MSLVKVEIYNFFKLPRGLTLVRWSKGNFALRVGLFQGKSAPCLVWCPWFFFYKWRYNVFNLSRDLMRVPRSMSPYVTTGFKDYVNLWVETPHRKSPPCHVGSCWSSACRDFKCLICYVISQNHVIEGSCNFMSENFSWYVTTLLSLVATDIAVVEIYV